MKRGLKNILIIILILILTIGTFNCAKKIMIRNIFDEMYFGTKDVWGGHLTSTSWNNMSGLAKTIDSVMDPAIGAVKVRSKGGIVCM